MVGPGQSRAKGQAEVAVVTLVLVILVGIATLYALPSSKAIQPIPFPHAVHVEIGMSCVSCHTGAEDGDHAGLPLTRSCSFCHRAEKQFPRTPPELAKYMESNEEIPWLQLHEVPRHVYFSHRRHTGIAELECEKCHGDVKSMREPFQESHFPQGMDGMGECVECHLKEGVSTDCATCHR